MDIIKNKLTIVNNELAVFVFLCFTPYAAEYKILHSFYLINNKTDLRKSILIHVFSLSTSFCMNDLLPLTCILQIYALEIITFSNEHVYVHIFTLMPVPS